jgi:hypothetical protein
MVSFPLPEDNLIYDRVWNQVNSPELPSFEIISKVFFIRALGDGDIVLEQVEIHLHEKVSTRSFSSSPSQPSVKLMGSHTYPVKLLPPPIPTKYKHTLSPRYSKNSYTPSFSSARPAIHEDEYELTPNPAVYSRNQPSFSQIDPTWHSEF